MSILRNAHVAMSRLGVEGHASPIPLCSSIQRPAVCSSKAALPRSCLHFWSEKGSAGPDSLGMSLIEPVVSTSVLIQTLSSRGVLKPSTSGAIFREPWALPGAYRIGGERPGEGAGIDGEGYSTIPVYVGVYKGECA